MIRVNEHTLVRSLTESSCQLCDNKWSSTDGVINRYYSCSECGMKVHSGCKLLSNLCFPCEKGIYILPELTRKPIFEITGRIFVKVLHAFDINTFAGSSLYGVITLPAVGEDVSIKTSASVCGDNACIWNEGNSESSAYSEDFFSIKVDEEEDFADDEKWTVTIDIWTSYLGFFGSAISTSQINIQPIFRHPNLSLERWFPMANLNMSGTGYVDGKLLVSFKFEPETLVVPKRETSHDSHATRTTEHNNSVMSDYLEVPIYNTDIPLQANPSEEDIVDVDDHVAEQLSDATTQSPHHQANQNLERSESAANKTVSVKKPVTPTHGNNPMTEPISMETMMTSLLTLGDSTKQILSDFLYDLEGGASSSWKDSALNLVMQPGVNVSDSGDIIPAAPSDLKMKTDILDSNNTGVGLMHINLTSAFKFNVRDAAEGDHYVILSLADNVSEPSNYQPASMQTANATSSLSSANGLSNREIRTNTVHSSATPIFNVTWTVKMAHFRSSLKIFLVDANTNRRIGYTKLSVVSVMQRKADTSIEIGHQSVGKNKQKSSATAAVGGGGGGGGVHADQSISDRLILKDMNDKQDIGYLVANVSFEEDIKGLFLSEKVHLAPDSPQEQLSVERLSAHINRFGAIIDWVTLCFDEYLRLMNWSDPLVTFVAFISFLYCTIRIHAEYSLSGIVFVLVVLMTRTFLRRKFGFYKNYYAEKGIKKPKFEHVPVASLRISVLGVLEDTATTAHTASNKTTVKVSYIPMPESDDRNYNNNYKVIFDGDSEDSTQQKIAIAEADSRFTPSKISMKEFSVGYFGSQTHSLILSSPESRGQGAVSQIVSNIVGSSEGASKGFLLHNVNDYWPLDEKCTEFINKLKVSESRFAAFDFADICLVYPILQPNASKIKLSTLNKVGTNSNTKKLGTPYLPWEENSACIFFAITNENHTSFIDNVTHEYVKVSVGDLFRHGGSLSSGDVKSESGICICCPVAPRWEQFNAKSELLEGVIVEAAKESRSSSDFSEPKPDARKPKKQMLLRIRLIEASASSSTASTNGSAESGKEASIALQSILQASVGPKDGSSTISVIWNMRDNVKYVQNLMNWLLDLIESFKNILNWTAPGKTYPIYMCLLGIWFVTIIIPGRIIILIVGLYQFLAVLIPPPKNNSVGIKFQNFLKSIPNDDDIEQVYVRERKKVAEKYTKQLEDLVNKKKMSLCLPLLWKGVVHVKYHNSSSGSSGGGGSAAAGGGALQDEWMEVVLFLQGSRLVWWLSEAELDIHNCKEPLGQLLLCGHTGVTQPSPVDIKKFEDDSRLIAVFGRDALGCPQKITILCTDSASKSALVRVIESIIASNQS